MASRSDRRRLLRRHDLEVAGESVVAPGARSSGRSGALRSVKSASASPERARPKCSSSVSRRTGDGATFSIRTVSSTSR
jgi:hypothetical protein